jgi:muconolactone delta-isomerase
MADRNLPGITMEQLAAAQKSAIQVGNKMTSQGKPVRYIRSTFVPGDSRCMCLFEAPNAENVRELNETAKIPFTRIVEAEDLTPAPGTGG